MTHYRPIIAGIFIIFQTLTLHAITDSTPNDPHYSEIKKAVKKGYFSLYNDNAFQPNSAISRRDAVRIIQSLEQQLNQKQLTLSKQDVKDLNAFAQSFKQTHIDQQNKIVTLTNKNKALETEQKMLHNDLKNLHMQRKKEQKLIYILLATTGLLGILF